MSDRILIIGHDLAGLTTAWRLLQQGFRVTILSGPSQPSQLEVSGGHGRESRISDAASPAFQEGRPLLLYGPQDQTRSLLRDIGVSLPPHHLTPLHLAFLCTNGSLTFFRLYPFPTPWHTVGGVLTCSGLPFRARVALLSHMEALWEEAISPPQGLDQQSADSWLIGIGQPPSTFPTFWNPLCRFVLGDDLTATSAENFTAALSQWFLSARGNAPIFASPRMEEATLIQPLKEQLLHHGAAMWEKTRADSLLMNPDRVTGIRTEEGNILSADWYVASLPPPILTRLLPERVLAKSAYFYHVSQLRVIPSVSCTFILPRVMTPSQIVLTDSIFHWIMSQVNMKGKSTMVSCVATGQKALLDQSDLDLLEMAKQALRDLPPLQEAILQYDPVTWHIVREPHALLSPALGMAGLRPSQQSPISNLFLAGAWTDTGLPPGRESAIVSGNRCSNVLTSQAASSPAQFDNASCEP